MTIKNAAQANNKRSQMGSGSFSCADMTFINRLRLKISCPISNTPPINQ